MTLARTKRFIKISSTNAPYHPYWGGNGYFYGGYMLVDVPYYQREAGILPPSHYTFCAAHSPVDNHVLLLGEVVTVEGLDQNDYPVQVDFIAGIWPGVDYDHADLGDLFAGNMENGYWTGIPGRGGYWTEYTHVDGGIDQGVTEELHYSHWLHSNCHRLPNGFYIPPAPPLGHRIIPPQIFGRSPDFHVNGKWGLYDCRAADIPLDDRYALIPLGPVTLSIRARYDPLTGANIMVGGEPIDLAVKAMASAPEDTISEDPSGGLPAGYAVQVDTSNPHGTSISIGAATNPGGGQSLVYTFEGGNYNVNTGLVSSTPYDATDAVRGQTLTVELMGSPIDQIDMTRGQTIAVSVGEPGNQVTITYNGTATPTASYRGQTVALVDAARGQTVSLSAPAAGQTLVLTTELEGVSVVSTVEQQVDKEETVETIDVPGMENFDVTHDVTIEDDPTEAPSEEEMAGGVACDTEAGAAIGDTTNDGNGGGDNYGNGFGDQCGGGGGPDGGDGTGGDGDGEGAE